MQVFKRIVTADSLALAGMFALIASPAAARIPMAMPGPSSLMYIGLGLVGAIVAFRVSRRK